MTNLAQEAIIYDALLTAALDGKPCPSNRVLGLLIDRDPKQAGNVMARLHRQGRIRVQSGGGFRVVRITKIGRSTAKSTRTEGAAISVAPSGAASDRMGCDDLHRRTLDLYARMAAARGCSIETAMLHAQHGRALVERLAA